MHNNSPVPAATRPSSRTAPVLDGLDLKILRHLKQDGRMPYAALGREIGLSTAATHERVRKLIDHGVIRRFTTVTDDAALDGEVHAIVRLATTSLQEGGLQRFVCEQPGIKRCLRITGEDCFLVELRVRRMHELEPLIEGLHAFGRSTTSIVVGDLKTASSD